MELTRVGWEGVDGRVDGFEGGMKKPEVVREMGVIARTSAVRLLLEMLLVELWLLSRGVDGRDTDEVGVTVRVGEIKRLCELRGMARICSADTLLILSVSLLLTRVVDGLGEVGVALREGGTNSPCSLRAAIGNCGICNKQLEPYNRSNQLRNIPPPL